LLLLLLLLLLLKLLLWRHHLRLLRMHRPGPRVIGFTGGVGGGHRRGLTSVVAKG
jgi:hypothetical protein